MLVHDHLEFWAQAFPGRPAAADGQHDWTFGELDGRANRVAHALRSLGVGPGARFAVLAKNCLELIAIYYGAAKCGAVPVPLNYRLTPNEWAYLVGDSGSRLVLSQDVYTEAIDQVRPQLDGVASFLSIGADTSWRSWEKLLDSMPQTRPQVTIETSDDLYQMYTSGTTGRPKGAVLSHAAIDANITQLAVALPLMPGDEVLTVMPLYHAGAAVGSLTQLARGAHLNVMADFDAAACVAALDERGIASAVFVPAMIQAMLDVPDVASRRYPSLRSISYGASPIAEETLRRAIGAFGCDFYQAYGMTETASCLTLMFPDDHRRALRGKPELLLSCGKPLPGTAIRIVDEDDEDVATGEVGQLIARGPQLMTGYWHDPEATRVALKGGWMHTGDAGYQDDEGYIYICDRVKDMICSGGENIYPREVENVIFEMVQIADCAVIGVPDARWGEAVKAIVVARPGATVTPELVGEWCRDRLAAYKRPKSVDVVELLPRNPSGKVLRTELRAPYWQGHVRNIG